MIDFDLSALLTVFDELLPFTNEEQKIYWLKSTRPDQISISLSFSAYEQTAEIILRCNSTVSLTSIFLKDCFAIRVLDEKHKCLEILSGKAHQSWLRCFLALDSENILEAQTFS